MNKASLLIGLSALFFIGCASVPTPPPAPPASDIWPKIYQDETYLADFASGWTEDEAVGAIRNLQNSFVESNADLPVTELNVDAFGVRARWSWVEMGNIQKSAGFIIPFDQITSVLLEYYPASEKAYKWGINVYITGVNPVVLRMPNREAAERFGKAVVVLAKARKAPLSMPNMRFGAAVGSLTADQSRAAGVLQSAGVIVSWVFRESPAEKAGFSSQDIITSVAGKTVQKGQELFDIIEAAAAAGATELALYGLRRTYRTEGDKYVEVFVPIRFTLPIAQPGGAK
ncbi:MAG: PDZ domain-containing protein [Spirochaetales bacterium]|nr:PDZ domain-containing protein [Spirochaetales bacterium]